jgi:hypothetical protein
MSDVKRYDYDEPTFAPSLVGVDDFLPAPAGVYVSETDYAAEKLRADRAEKSSVKWMLDFGMECKSREEIAAKLQQAESALERAREALRLMYDKWENGIACYEANEEGDCSDGASLGNAFKLSPVEEQGILNIIADAALTEANAQKEREKP